MIILQHIWPYINCSAVVKPLIRLNIVLFLYDDDLRFKSYVKTIMSSLNYSFRVIYETKK